mmetsp:Transcript_34566/g.87411  ORF Transcript_34566/g.87411 Transcript_34566/m.87411 type:complete len:250 (-) Transcript_34566:290-1039(-)|eukprot:CAMPEP_0202868944 /NCGR_PEP_ID=MMETSP1391-20130828/11448_1 /ASSEMBLY_ACC=CAM_ASM_000867 /TAXON_ID=1034604 /ORGANISM="Chlamydomonas leiostraca, Strain SAG 11-49" /LENGTH=249 /DNA_ID=CAMNT_0049549177 /DNA_START=114 /DNA_END=863 /DNA_ORIENTATION=+
MYLLASSLLLILSAARAAEYKDPSLGVVTELSDENFDQHIDKGGIWLVKVYAPWCSHCRQMEPVWQALAKELEEHNVHVAKIDGTRNRLLMSRFRVEAYPSMFLLRDSRTWSYQGTRSVSAIKEFVLDRYKASSPLPVHKCPNHWVGRVLGKVHSLPKLMWRAYNKLKEEGGWSDLGILGAALAVPVVTGGILICLVDALYVQRGARSSHEEQAAGVAPVADPALGAEGFVDDGDGGFEPLGHEHEHHE